MTPEIAAPRTSKLIEIEQKILDLQDTLKTISWQLDQAKGGKNQKFQTGTDWFFKASDAQRHQRKKLQELVALKRSIQDGNPAEGPTAKAFIAPPKKNGAPDKDLVRERIACLLRLAKAANVIFGEETPNLTQEEKLALEDQIEKAEEDIVNQLDLLDSIWESWESVL